MNRVITALVTCLAFSVSGGAQVPRLQMQTSHTAIVRMIDYDASTSRCVTASNDFSVRVWSTAHAERGSLLRVLTGHQAGVVGAILNPNNPDNVISWSTDRTVRVWNIGAGTHTVIRPQDLPTAVDVRAGSNIIAVATATQEIEFFDIGRATTADRSIEVGFDVRMLRFSPSGDLLLVTGMKGELLLLRTRTRETVPIGLDTRRPLIGAYWTANDAWIAVSDAGDVYRGKVERIEQSIRLQTRVRAVSRQTSGSTIAIVTEGGDVVAVESETGNRRVLRKERDVMSVDAIALMSDDLLILGAEYKGGLHQIELRSMEGPIPTWRRSTKSTIITAVQYLEGSKDLLVGDNTGSCWYWSTRQGARPIQITNGEFDKVQVLCESPGRQHMLLGGFGQNVCGIVNLATWDIRWLPISDVRGVGHADFASPASILIVDDGTGDIINLDTNGTLLRRWPSRASRVFAIDSMRFLGVTDSEVQLYHRDSSKISASIRVGQSGSIIACGWNASDRRVTLHHSSGAVFTCLVSVASAKPLVCDQITSVGVVPTSTTMIVRRGNTLMSGADGTLRMLEHGKANVKSAADVCALFGRPTASAISSDGEFVAIGMQDGSVQIAALSTRGVVVTLHARPDGWTAATPTGMFDGDNATQSSLLVIVGSDIRTLSEMPSMYQVPNILRRVYRLPNAAPLATQPDVVDIRLKRPPRVNFFARSSAATTSEECTLTYRLQSQGASVRSVIVTEGSRVVYQRKASESSGIRSHIGSFRAALRDGVNQFTIRVLTFDGGTTVDTLSVARQQITTRPPMLYALIVGVNDYGVRHTSLSYAVGDAEKIEKALTSIHRRTSVTKLLNGDASRARITAELANLSSVAQPQDNVVIYFAGHGMSCLHASRDNAYCLIPFARDDDSLTNQEITIDALFAQIQRINASGMLVILDACQSGAVAESDGLQRTLVKDGESSVAVIASTTKTARAAESPVVGGGLFTHVIAEGLAGRARDSDGDITAFSLANYVSKKLPGLCQRVGVPIQNTVTQLGSTGTGMVISQPSN